jgi:nitrate reductase gamma subunit
VRGAPSEQSAQRGAPSEQPAQRGLLLAHRGLRSGLALRSALSLVGAAVLLACGIVMANHAIVDHLFPPFVAGAEQTVITSYSGPWLAGAIGVGALAGLLLVAAITDLWRRRLIGSDLRTSALPAAN